MKLAALTLAMLLLAGSAAHAFDGNDRILDVDPYQKLPPNPAYDAPVAFGYVAPAAVVRRVDYVPYGSQVTRTDYGVARYVAQRSYGYVAPPTYVVPPACGYVAQPTYGYVPADLCRAAPVRLRGAAIETRTHGYAVARTTCYVVPRDYGYTSVPRVYEPRR